MVIFNDLRISEDKNCLTVDCEIEGVDGYAGFYIDHINVYYYKFVGDEVSKSENGYQLYDKGEGDPKTHIRKSMDRSDIPQAWGINNFNLGMFIVEVVCDFDSLPNIDVLEKYGCGIDNPVDIGIIVDWKAVYEKGISYAMRLAGNCAKPCEGNTDFKQFILLWYALQLAISVCEYRQAGKLWDKFIRMFPVEGSSFSSLSSGCGCR